ncbi:RNA ligase family protein [Bradyrhizobium yuanmingense]|uniref:ATP-dependent DNA ligase n=1 Tax=Bradyrhizobium yuanmingense TaxID=108015 RepID=UPI001CD414F1|nr:RNA ligase family protein [Bradyrhizobium yuanmingense]MCA1530540.1 DNA ligase [Bradyrhizobium yuanmingense]
MKRDFAFALPVKAHQVPTGPDWIHEIKHDGYRLKVIRAGARVQLTTRNGLDYTKRYPWIVRDALKLDADRFVLDGEAVVLNLHGLSDFEALHSGQYNAVVRFYAFDMLEGEGVDLSRRPLADRKVELAKLLDGFPQDGGIHIAPYERGEIGTDLFKHGCLLGLEGIVSKHLDRAYKVGRCDHWVKVKNPNHPAYSRVQDAF